MLDHAKRIFQTDNFFAGIPSNLEAMSTEDCSTLKHHDFHILGRVVITDKLASKLSALLVNNPEAFYTADANWMRSRIRLISRTAQQLRQDRAQQQWDTSRTRAVRAVRAVLQSDAYQKKQSNLRDVTGNVPS